MKDLCTVWMCIVVVSAQAQFGPEQVAFQPTANAPSAMVLADVDGDGYNDIVVASVNDARISCFPNDGTGHCGPLQVLLEHAPPVNDLEAGDLDGDGDVDLLAAMSTKNRINWYRNDGLGHFSAPLLLTDSAFQVKDVSLSDLDGDGDPDVLSTSNNDAGLSWQANDGLGNFGAPQTIYAVGLGATAVQAADMDNDGDKDVVGTFPTYSDILWFRNAGNGTFTDTLLITSSTIYASTLAVDDVDGDGDQDVVAASSSADKVAWYANDGTGTFGSEVVLSQNLASAPGSKTTVLTADADADGDMDIVFGFSEVSAINLAYQAYVLMNNGDATFSPTAWSSYTHSEYITAIRIGQLDAGPAPELVTAYADNEVRVDTLSDAGNYGMKQVVAGSSAHVMMVRLADLNGDGVQDLITGTTEDDDLGDVYADDPGSVYFQAGDGQGHFGEPVWVGGGDGALHTLDLADADEDGDLDVFYTYEQTQAVYWTMNNGAAGFHSYGVHSALLALTSAVGDLDGDGDLDAVVPDHTNNVLYWYAYDSAQFAVDSTTTYSTSHLIATTTAPVYHSYVLDIDGDGDNDVAYGKTPLYWRANDGTGTFGPANTIPGGIGNDGDACFGDLDGDGDPDLVQALYSGSITWNANDGAGNFGPGQAIGSASHARISLADLDNDGRLDVLFGSENLNTVGWYGNIANGQFWEPHVISNTAVDAWHASAGDVDDDGDNDVVFASYSGSHASWFENFSLSLYQLGGRVFVDANNNGEEDGDEVPAGLESVHCEPAPAFAYTLPNGDYTLPAQSGSYVISYSGAPLWQLTTDSVAYHVELSTLQPTSTSNDFGIAPAMDSSIVTVDLTSGQGVCGSVIPQWIDVRNLGTRREHGYLEVRFDSLYAVQTTYPAADSIVGHTAYWNLDTLDYFEHLRFTALLLSPDAFNLGDTLNTNERVHLLDTLGAPIGTVEAHWNDILTCSFDPNDKSVLPEGLGDQHIVHAPAPSLDYTIRFQNTGNDTAYAVSIVDELSDRLDPSTLQVIGFSHPLTSLRVEPDGDVVADFANIVLPDSGSDAIGSQGYFRFRVRLAQDQPAVAIVENTAAIYFDLNPPVITNTTLTTVVDCDAFSATITQMDVNLFEASSGESYQWYLEGEPLLGATAQQLLVDQPGSYTVEVTNAYGCQLLSGEVQVIALGLSQVDGFRAVIVPNPINDGAKLIASEPLGTATRVDLLDMSGRELRTWRGNGSRELIFDRAGIANGVYVVRLSRAQDRPVSIRIVMGQ